MKHMLTIRIPIDGIDDPDARKKARAVLERFGIPRKGFNDEVKLQEILDNKPPRKIDLRLT